MQTVAAASFAVLLVVAGVWVSFRGERGNTLNAASDSPTTSRETEGVVVSTTTTPTTPTIASPTSVPVATTRTTRAPRTAAPPTTAQTEFRDAPAELQCVQTTKADPTPPPEDWATYWQTKPEPNQGLMLKICVEDRTPKVGTRVNLYVLADDPDAEIGTNGQIGECDIYVTWNSNSGSLCRDTAVAPNEPQPTPARKRGRVTNTYIHEYAEPGEWIIDVSAWSGPNSPEPHPYASYNSIELRVDVHR